MNNKKLTPFIRIFLKYWKRRLSLHGWTFSWQWASKAAVDELAGYEAVAVTTIDTAKQRAIMRINSEVAWQTEDEETPYYLPATLLHELLHIRFASAEVELDNLGALVAPYLPESVVHGVHGLHIAAREFYVEAMVAILLDQED